MTTEYRDGTVGELKPGQEVWIKVEVEDPTVDEGGSLRVIVPYSTQEKKLEYVEAAAILTAPPQPEFDLEAFRAELTNLMTKSARDGFAEFNTPYDALTHALDLLPPKPQVTLEEDLRKWTQTYIAPSLKYEPRENEEDTIVQGILAIVERHQS
jgi:hypothetical protein